MPGVTQGRCLTGHVEKAGARSAHGRGESGEGIGGSEASWARTAPRRIVSLMPRSDTLDEWPTEKGPWCRAHSETAPGGGARAHGDGRFFAAQGPALPSTSRRYHVLSCFAVPGRERDTRYSRQPERSSLHRQKTPERGAWVISATVCKTRKQLLNAPKIMHGTGVL